MTVRDRLPGPLGPGGRLAAARRRAGWASRWRGWPSPTPGGWPGGSSPPATCPRRSPPSRRCAAGTSPSRSTCSARRCSRRSRPSATSSSTSSSSKACRDAAAGWHADPLLDRDAAAAPLPRVNVSVKLSSLYSQFDPIDPDGTSRGRARAAAADPARWPARRGAFVNIDMEQFAFKDLTLRIFQRGASTRTSSATGRTSASPSRRTCATAATTCDDLADWARAARHAGLGAAGQGGVLGLRDRDRRPERLAGAGLRAQGGDRRQLRAADGVPAGAPRRCSGRRSPATTSAASPTRWRWPSGTACRRGGFEFQMLYGMAEPIKTALVSMGQRVRVYTPYGELLPGMAYLVRRLLENTANESFLRAGFTRTRARGAAADEPAATADRAADEPRAAHGHATTRRDARATGAGRPVLPQRAADRLQPGGRPARRCGRRWTRSPSSSARPTRWSSAARRIDDGPRRSSRSTRRTAGRSSAAAARPTAEHARAGRRGGQRRVPGLARHAGAERRASCLLARRRRHAPAALRAGGVGGLRDGQAVARGRRRRGRGDRLLRLLRAARCCASPRRSGATCPARRTSTSTSRAAWPSSSRRGTSRWPSSAA